VRSFRIWAHLIGAGSPLWLSYVTLLFIYFFQIKILSFKKQKLSLGFEIFYLKMIKKNSLKKRHTNKYNSRRNNKTHILDRHTFKTH
jgi:hypothetical protein